ncbi:MAG: VOC family protein [Myxococcota bacterium]
MGSIPYLAYADAPAAITFLSAAFGFVETFRMDQDDGTVGHAELTAGPTADDGVVYLATAWRAAGQAPPSELGGTHGQVVVRVADVDAHHARARAAGATIAAEPADQPYGERVYRAVDPEGHRWIFTSGPR